MAQAMVPPARRAVISARFGGVSIEMTALVSAGLCALIHQDVFCDASVPWRKRSGQRDLTTLHRAGKGRAALRTTDECRLLMRNVDVVDDLLDARHLTDNRFSVPFCQAPIDYAIQIDHIIKRLHSDRSGRS
jgi:hypothetical protein